MQSQMKYKRTAGALCLVMTLSALCLSAPVRAQDFCETVDHDVIVAMWMLPTPAGKIQQKTVIHQQLVEITNDVLDAINNRSQPDNDKISVALMSKLARDFNAEYCVRKGRANPDPSGLNYGRYNLLLVPDLDEPDTYEIRGLHLVSNDNGTADLPQATLVFKIEGTAVTLEDIRVETSDERDAKMRERMPADDARARTAYDLVHQLEAAYNKDGEAIFTSMQTLLDDARVGQVDIIVSQLGKPDRRKSARQYIQDLRRNIDRYGETVITYEFVDVYRLNNPDIYRVTLLQHWMYEDPNTYVDSDFLAIDVVFHGGEPAISRRQAGRGAFNVYSRPSNVQITRFNGRDWSDADPPRVTPFEQIINAPLQFHDLSLENVWYEQVDTMRTPEDVLNLRNLEIEMQHKDATVVLNVVPEPRGATFLINGQNERPVINGQHIPIPWAQLGGVPAAEGEITSDERTVQLEVRHPDLNPETFFEQHIILESPDPHTVNVPFPTGTLAVRSVPTPASVLVNGQNIGETPVDQEMNVTPRDAPLAVQVKSEGCLPGAPEHACQLHIPSEIRSVPIASQQTSEEVFYLMPFLVRNETAAGNITAMPIERNGNLVTVRYTIEDTRDRNRKFSVDLDLKEMPGDNKLADLEEEVACVSADPAAAEVPACLGRNIRPGEYAFTWDVSEWGEQIDATHMPVLTLRRKKTCWPCVLLPAAAGVAAAYIWPRTGSGGDDGTFVPPPRP